MNTTPTDLRFTLTGMDCASCARTIETGVMGLPGVAEAEVHYGTSALVVRPDADGPAVEPEAVVARVRALGYGATGQPVGPAAAPPPPTAPTGSLFRYLLSRQDTRLALLAGVLVLPGLIFDELLGGGGPRGAWTDGLSVAAMALAGWPVARAAWRSLRVSREVTINLLMSLAAVGAVVIGAYTEAGLVMVLFALGEAIEGHTAGRARDAIGALSELAPREATRLVATDVGLDIEQRVAVEALRPGDRVAIRPGERLPMDGRVLAGESAVDQSPITGESRPVGKAPGDELLAGSVNGTGHLEAEVTRLVADSTISRIIRMVAEAQERRAPAQRLVDRFARVYTPAVIAVAVIVAAVPPLAWGAPFWDPAPGEQGWLYRALALLVVACPCALVLSTPVTIASAIGNAARHGIVFKGGAHLEALSRVRAMAFDKTGTLTAGAPAVVDVRCAGCPQPEADDCASCDELVALAASLERRSEHPLARAVLAEAQERGVEARYGAARSVRALPGQGVTGEVEGRAITLGSHAWFEGHVPHAADCGQVAASDAQGRTTMLLSDGARYRGFLAATDLARAGSREAIADLGALGMAPLLMLTGDNRATALSIAQELAITDVRAECLPQDKLDAVAGLRARFGEVAMVGDGINDTPAFAESTVGVAMGRTAQALETADIVLLGDDLRQLPYAVRLSRAAMGTVRANVALSLGIKLAFLILVLAGLGSMWLAVLADMGTSLLVTANGMRLLWRPAPGWGGERLPG